MQDAAIKFVHGDINNHLRDIKYMLNNVIVCPRNRNTRKINEKIVQKLESPEFFCFSSNLTSNDFIYISEEVLDTFEFPGPPLTSYILRITCRLCSLETWTGKENFVTEQDL